jgi:diguanylate cyclase (GGDEF)-like protein
VIGKKFDELRLTGALPSPSALGLRILAITQEDDYEQVELERAVMADPALAGRILKLANSALHDSVEPATTVPQAAMRLGSGAVRTLALGFTLISDNRTGAADAFDYDGHWSRALAAASAATALAVEIEDVHSADAFTCALLCDVGCLALASVHPERYSALLEGCPTATGLQLADLETQAFDIDHYEVCAALLSDWGLPENFRRAVLTHERDLGPGEERAVEVLGRLLRASKAVAEVIVQGEDPTNPDWVRAVVRLEQTAEELDLDLDGFLGVCDSVATSWGEWSELLGMEHKGARAPSVLLSSLATERPAPLPVCAPGVVVNEERLQHAISPPSVDAVSVSIEDLEARPTRILLVDDDQRMLKLIRHHLIREGYEVATADSSALGLRTALESRPQLVVTDWMMPGMSGLELCAALRETDAGRRMYILVVTAREDDEQVVEAFAAGADDYIVKPFNPRILLARVRAGQRMVLMRERVEAAERLGLRQVAELGILTRKLRAAAMTDPLTELPNRRYAMKRLKAEWDSSSRTSRPLSVVLADIDHFKRVNDVYGHDAGDEVLREVAALLRRRGRSGEVLCRVGGEEFLSIDMACTAEEAASSAERLRKAIEGLEIRYPGFEGNVTLSLGVAQRTEDMTCFDDLIKAADEALYAAKSQGRNRVVIADDEIRGRRSA